MTFKKMPFLPWLGSNAKTKHEALPNEHNEMQKDIDVSLMMTESPLEEPASSMHKDFQNLNTDAEKPAQHEKPRFLKKTFLRSKFSLSVGRKNKKDVKDDNNPTQSNVSCEVGSNEGDNNVAIKDIEIVGKEDDKTNENQDANGTPPPDESTKKQMSALEKLMKGDDDEDINLRELASDIKGKVKGVFKKDKKVVLTTELEGSQHAEPITDDGNKAGAHLTNCAEPTDKNVLKQGIKSKFSKMFKKNSANKVDVSDNRSGTVDVKNTNSYGNEEDASNNDVGTNKKQIEKAESTKEDTHLDKPLSNANDKQSLRNMTSIGGATHDASKSDELYDAPHSRSGFGNNVHETLMTAGEYIYNTCGSSCFGTNANAVEDSKAD